MFVGRRQGDLLPPGLIAEHSRPRRRNVMDRDRAIRALEMCQMELRAACAARNRSAAHYWALQLRDNQEWLKRYLQREEVDLTPSA
jgi:hypothetical protein